LTALASFLLLLMAQLAFAEPLTVDSWNVDQIKFHLNIVTNAIDQGKLNRARNHANLALGLLVTQPGLVPQCPVVVPKCPSPDQDPVVLSTFQINIPFQWNQSKGPMPISINALKGWALPQPDFTGTVGVSIAVSGTLVALYDQSMTPLTNNQTTNFFWGNWTGYIMLRTPTGQTADIALHAHEPVSDVVGTSNAVTWTVP
jgi:hypothetical protein